jgi:hypothetical protein
MSSSKADSKKKKTKAAGKKAAGKAGGKKSEKKKTARRPKKKTAKRKQDRKDPSNKRPELEVVRLDEAAERKRRETEYDEILEFVLEDMEDMVDGLTEAALNIACVDEWREWADGMPDETEVELEDDAFDGCNDVNIRRLMALRTEIDRVALEIVDYRKKGRERAGKK